MHQDDPLIKKETLHPGTKCVEFKPGTKVCFHFQIFVKDKSSHVPKNIRRVIRLVKS